MSKIKTILKAFFIFIIVVMAIYFCSLLAQIFANLSFHGAELATGKTNLTDLLPNLNFFKSITSLLIFPHNLKAIAFCLLAIGGLSIYIHSTFRTNENMDSERNFSYSEKGTYGTAGFLEKKNIAKIFDLSDSTKNAEGFILGEYKNKIVSIPLKTFYNNHVAVYGASGTMKSRAYARNTIFQCVRNGHSLLITDPKSELFKDSCIYLKRNGYLVKTLNLINFEYSDSWNCLNEIGGDEIMAQTFVDVIIQNTGSTKGDKFWDNAESNLLRALVLYVELNYPAERRNIGEVYDMLTTIDRKELDSLFNILDIRHPAKASYEIFKQSSDNVRGGVIVGLGSRLQVFQNKVIKEITSKNDIDIELMKKEKCAYFCITSDQDSTFDFLSSLFLSFVFIKLVKLADRQGKNSKANRHVHILADELANIGVIPDLKKKISTVRSRGISMSVIFQNLAQMQNRYPNNQWAEIIGNCDIQLFLGCTDDITAEYISKRTGDVTIDVASKSKELQSLRMSNYTHKYRETSSLGRRKLMTPDEILRLPIQEAIVIPRGEKVFKVKKFDFTKHHEAKKLIPIEIYDYSPAWRKGNAISVSEKENKELIDVCVIEKEAIETIEEENIVFSEEFSTTIKTEKPKDIERNDITKKRKKKTEQEKLEEEMNMEIEENINADLLDLDVLKLFDKFED